MKHVAIILQARSRSTRLPNKVLMPLQSAAVLSHCIRRLALIDQSVPVIVATSTEPPDDAVAQLAITEGAKVYRGSETDVLDRYYQAACKHDALYVIRATADNPFVDIEEGRRILSEIMTGTWDYVSMLETINGRGLPLGVGLEAFTLDALRESWLWGRKPHHREHVNEFILEHSSLFTCALVACHPQHSCPDLRLTIDTQADFIRIENLLADLGRPVQEITTIEAIGWWRRKVYDRNPH